jgi:hypothetical protein
VVAHWFGLMNQNGWIPREQILDEAARSKVSLFLSLFVSLTFAL